MYAFGDLSIPQFVEFRLQTEGCHGNQTRREDKQEDEETEGERQKERHGNETEPGSLKRHRRFILNGVANQVDTRLVN